MRIAVYKTKRLMIAVAAIGLSISFVAPIQHLKAANDPNWIEVQPAGNNDADWSSVISGDGSRAVISSYFGRYMLTSGNKHTKLPPGPAINSMNSDASIIIGLAYDGIYRSTDYGSTWTNLYDPHDFSTQWTGSAVSNDGATIVAVKMAASGSGSKILISTDAGTNWHEVTAFGSNPTLSKAVMSTDGNTIVIAVNGRLQRSTNQGANWTEMQPAGNFDYAWGAEMSNDGQTIVASAYGHRTYKSINGGTSWAELRPLGDNDEYWSGLSMDGTGQTMVMTTHVVVSNSQPEFYLTKDGGVSWSKLDLPAKQILITISDSGQRMILNGYRLFTSGFSSAPTNDHDQDGVSNDEEAQGPDGGDANGDGTSDRLQVNVSSFNNPLTGNYVALAAPDTCTVSNVSTQNESTIVQDAAYDYPYGLVNFKAACGSAGFSTTITAYFYTNKDNTIAIARKYNANTHAYTTIPGATVASVTMKGGKALKVVYTAIDGGNLDADNAANGIFVDPLGITGTIEAVGAPNTGLGGSFTPQ